MQLQIYEEYNKFLQNVHSREEAERQEYLADRFQETAEHQASLLNTQEGESLSIEDLSDIYMQVRGETRARDNMSLNTHSRTGDISDYLETRRPFGTAQ